MKQLLQLAWRPARSARRGAVRQIAARRCGAESERSECVATCTSVIVGYIFTCQLCSGAINAGAEWTLTRPRRAATVQHDSRAERRAWAVQLAVMASIYLSNLSY